MNEWNIQLRVSLVNTTQREEYTRANVTRILCSVSRLYSVVLKGYSHFCLWGILNPV